MCVRWAGLKFAQPTPPGAFDRMAPASSLDPTLAGSVDGFHLDTLEQLLPRLSRVLTGDFDRLPEEVARGGTGRATDPSIGLTEFRQLAVN